MYIHFLPQLFVRNDRWFSQSCLIDGPFPPKMKMVQFRRSLRGEVSRLKEYPSFPLVVRIFPAILESQFKQMTALINSTFESL